MVAKTVARDPFLARPRLLNQHDADFLVSTRIAAEIPPHECCPKRRGKGDTGTAESGAIAIDQPHSFAIRRRIFHEAHRIPAD